MKKFIIFILLLIGMISPEKIFSQKNGESFKRLSTAMFENLMLSNRVIRDYVFIISKNFKTKSIQDMDKTLGRFDYNMNLISNYLPEDKKLKEKFDNFKYYINQSRLELMDFENPNYESFIRNLQQSFDENREIADKILEKQLDFKKNKKIITKLTILYDLVNEVEKIAIDYILKNYNHHTKGYLDTNLKQVRKKIKELSKTKKLSPKAVAILSEMRDNYKLISDLVENPSFRPKMMYVYVNNFASKAFKLLPQFINLYSN